MANYNIFIYGEAEISYLKKRDKRFAEVIDKVGPIDQFHCGATDFDKGAQNNLGKDGDCSRRDNSPCY